MMSVFYSEFHEVLKELEVFDVYFCDDEQIASEFFNTTMMPLELPHIYIIEPKINKEIEPRDGQSTSSSNHYTTKYQGFIFNIN